VLCVACLQLRLSAFETPYGDAQLDPVGIPKAVRQKLVWEELEHRMRKGEPVKVRHTEKAVVPSAVCHCSRSDLRSIPATSST
jgi:hypothetical protein